MNATKVTGSWHFGLDGVGDYRSVVVSIHIRTVSETNMREHHMARHRRRKAQRQAAGLVMIGALRAEGIKAPCCVQLTRVAPSNGLDGDNLVSSLKAVRDGVADALGLDDADPSITWTYRQERGNWREYAVRISVTELRGDA